MKHLLTILATTLLFNSFGQLKAKMANEHYNRMEYALCVDMYDELANKLLKTKTGNDSEWEYVRRSAICHYQLFEMKKSTEMFTNLKSANRLTEKDREFFIQSLRFIGRYADSESLIHESTTLHPNNPYFKRLSESKNEFNRLFEDSSFYTVKDAGINSGMGDFAPSYSPNGIAYASKSENTKAIHPSYGWDNSYYINLKMAEKTSDSTLGKGTLMKHEFLSKAHDGPVSFNSKGNYMVITKNTLGKKKGKDVIVLSLYFSKLINGEWTELVPFTYNNSEYNVGHAVFAEGDKALYFVSDKPGGFGEADIYVSRLTPNNEWSEPVNLGPTINTEQNEFFPFVYDNTLYFASNGHFGLGGLDLFEKQLATSEKPHNLGYPVNTSFDDFGLIVDTTTLRGYFSSNRIDNIDRIYSFKKRPININLIGVVYAKYKENEPLVNQTITIYNQTTKQSATLTSNEFGQFFSKIKLNEDYKITTEKEEFILMKEALVSTQGIKKDSTFYCELALKPTTIQVHLRVVEQRSGKIIPLAKTSVTDYSINKDTTMMTNELGTVTMKVDRNKSYWAHASKKGYMDDNVAFNSANENDKVIDLELRLPPIVKGDRFKLENIFYDLNKSTLRPESMLALDKLADFITKNDLKIELSAHTDARGSDAYNLKLSQARAQSCVDYLITKGVRKSNIVAKGYGETKLINKCKNGVTCPEEMHQENRRTEVKIL
jgi:outer membrane protein OmpA-like peptidoglycan-associated protein